MWTEAYEHTYNKLSYDMGTGQIQNLKKSGDVVNVTFKAAKWTNRVGYDCVKTRRIYRIHSDGRVEYEQNCKYKTVTQSSTMQPVNVPSEFARGLKPGMVVDFVLDRDGKAGRTGIPREVWGDTNKTSFAGTFGAVW